ncbi:MAG: crotonase/enoyl-CoA hydratase family protein [Burkholderiaceae bacterium]|nr:crotonase/enoyl-CoA hydratase family protein [Burkholderiaceae bacterium]
MSGIGEAPVLVERGGAVTTIVLNRPHKRNAVDEETADLLRDAFLDFDADDGASVAVLAGAGSDFCAGADLARVAEGMRYEPEGVGPMGPTRLLLNKPVIAAIEGHAVAGGLELAIWCDLRVASRDAIFGVFCRRWGVPLVDGGTVRLPRLIGQGRALDMILTGRPVDAVEALSFGLVDRVVAPGSAREAAEGLARDIARFPQSCLRADRISAHRQWGTDLSEALRREGLGGAPVIREEAPSGAARFAAGRGRGGDFGLQR